MSPEEGLQAVVSLLRKRVAHYDWVGVYLVQDGKLKLRSALFTWCHVESPLNVDTEHTEIDIGAGICGLAAQTRETVIVDDVNQRPEYLACFINTQSEIVVPLMRGGECVGEIDIDSDKSAAFGAEDQAFLERVAAMMVAAYFED